MTDGTRAPSRGSRRRRLITRTAIAGGLMLIVVALAVALPRASRTYDPSENVDGITSALDRTRPAGVPGLRFREVAGESGIHFEHFAGVRTSQLPEDMGSGAAWGDYDGDGDEDLFLVNVSGPMSSPESSPGSPAESPPGSGFDLPGASCRLYRNDGEGRFTDITDQAGVGLRIRGMAAAWADYDGDGRLDLLVSSHPRLVLLRNAGDGRFEDVTARAGLAAFEGFWAGLSWADHDGDGWIDVYVCGYVRYQGPAASAPPVALQYQAEMPFTLNPSSHPPERNLLLRNTGRGTFEDVAKEAGVANDQGRSLTAAWCDLDDDGRLDLYVANDVSDNALYLNRGGGRFADVSHRACVADYRGAMGQAIGDWDGDGDLDLFVTHWIAQENALYSRIRLAPAGDGGTVPVFMDVADRVGLGQIALDVIGWGTGFLDLDSDGRLDLYVINGSTFQDPADRRRLLAMPHFLFWNGGSSAGFYEVGAAAGETLVTPTVGRGSAHADYDGDGDLDLVVVNHSGRAWLLRNDSDRAGRWLQVRARSRRDPLGIGARVVVTSRTGRQVRSIGCQPSYLSQSSTVAHFGLGPDPGPVTVDVTFPGGRRAVIAGAGIDRQLVVDEPTGEAPVGAGAPAGAGAPVGGEAPEDRAKSGGPPGPAGPPPEAPARGARGREDIRRFWRVYEKASAARRSGAFEEAIRGYRDALRSRPDHEDSLYYLGYCLVNTGDYTGALEAYHRLVAVNPAGSSRGYMRIGRIHSLFRPGAPLDLTRAREAYEKALDVDPDSGASLNLAEVALLEGRYAEARRQLERLASVNAIHPAPPYLLGYLAFREGAEARALEAFGEAHRRFLAGRPPRGRSQGRSEEGDVRGDLETRWRPVAEQSLLGELWIELGLSFDAGAGSLDLMRAHFRRLERLERPAR